MLRDLNIKKSYRSDEHNLIRDFYIPCLTESVNYQRAVGFFSSSSLSVAAKGIHSFIRSGGRMELVASPYLSRDDIEEINNGYKLRHELELKSILTALEGDFDPVTEQRLGMLAWLIEHQRLDIKIAVLKNKEKYGIYHEKLGIFFDGIDYVAFSGSPNESESGLVSNFENIDVFCSWRSGEEDRVEEKINNFEKLWQDQTRLLSIFPFPEAARMSILRRRLTSLPDKDPGEVYEVVKVSVPHGCPCLPEYLKLRSYQRNAIENWFSAGGKGTLMMATGSGKTITALSIIEKRYSEYGLRAVIIIAPFRHLVTQWAIESKKFGLDPICCFGKINKWNSILTASLFGLQSNDLPFISVIVTNSTFSSKGFQALLKFFPEDTLIIGDESHNLGSKKLLSLLPVHVLYRLALSATPERWFDLEGTEKLFSYFGQILFRFTLKEAMQQNALVPYRYYPIFVNLTEEESEKFLVLSKKIAPLFDRNKKLEENSKLTILLNQRARLIGAAFNKLAALKKIMQDRLDTSHTLFYCGDGSVEEPITEETEKQISKVCQLLGYELGFRVDIFTAETSLEERGDLKEKFDSGELQGLVAIRCLDEGVDIPSTQTAIILASSSNPRQFIQRRGRVLRRAKNKKEAIIFDMIVLPPINYVLQYKSEKTLLKKELDRCLEFSDLAINSGEVRGMLIDAIDKYNLY